MTIATSGSGRRFFGAIAVVALASARLPGQQVLAEWDSKHASLFRDHFGCDIARLGDLNGDGWPEVLVGSDGYDPVFPTIENGIAVVVSTKDGSFLQTCYGSHVGSLFGHALDGGPDLDGDGIPDYAIGSPRDSYARRHGGRVYVFSGATKTRLYPIDATGAHDYFGSDLSFVGDVDGDRTEDLVVTAANWDNQPSGPFACGRIYCYSGRTGAKLWSFDGTQQDQELGRCCPLDDFNGDGIPEVGAGSIGPGSGVAGEGTFDVLDGRTGSSLARISGENPLDAFGYCGRTGDIDRDGVRDILIGAPGWSGNFASAGRVYLVSGATLAILRRFDGEQSNEAAGSSSFGFGDVDVNADGWADVVFASRYRLRAGCALGVQSFYCGRTFRLLHEIRAQKTLGIEDGLGTAGVSIPDIDADGWPDAVLSSYGPGVSPTDGEGRAYLVAMKPVFVQGDQSEYQPGDSITLRLCGGTPGVLGMIALVSIGGVPRLDLVSFGALDAFGELTHLDVADPTLSGLTIEVQGFCQKPNGRGALASAPETIDFP